MAYSRGCIDFVNEIVPRNYGNIPLKTMDVCVEFSVEYTMEHPVDYMNNSIGPWHPLASMEYSTADHGLPRSTIDFHGTSYVALRGTPWHSMGFHGTPWNMAWSLMELTNDVDD